MGLFVTSGLTWARSFYDLGEEKWVRVGRTSVPRLLRYYQ